MTGTTLPRVGDEFGRYRIDGQIGFGGMGMVLAATDTQLGRKVALKVISPQLAASEEFRTRFEREAALMTRMDSPHVLTVYDHGVIDGIPWLATPYVAGGDVGQLLRERGAMPLPMAATICGQVAGALHDAHQVGIIHRDVKPANILLRDPEAPEPFGYLCDFGIAHTGDSGLTQAGSVAGSWAYIAPERIKGGPGTPQTDVYALGCVLWACLTGQAPYSGTDMEVAMAHAQSPVPQFDGTDPVSQQVNAVLAKALAKDPAERYATAADFQSDLRVLSRAGQLDAKVPAALSGGPGLTTTRGSHQGPRRRKGVLIVGAVAGLALVAGAATAGWFVLEDDGEGSRDDQQPVASGPWVEGDMNGDGKADLAFGDFNVESKGGNRIHTIFSTGSAFATESHRGDPRGLDSYGDWDGDGQVDLVSNISTSDDGLFRARIHPDEGEPIMFKPLKKGNRGKAYSMLGDVDGDGRDDLVLWWEVGDKKGTAVEVALSTDEGFAEPKLWYRESDLNQFTDYYVLGDLTGDGKADLVAVEGATKRAEGQAGKDGAVMDTVRYLENQGDGFVEVGERMDFEVPGIMSMFNVVIADVDGDGDGELVASRPDHPSSEFTVHPVTADGLQPPTTTYADRMGGGESSDVFRAMDVDGDGDSDLVIVRDKTTESIDVQVALWNGEGFDDPTTWYSWKCKVAECDGGESLSLLSRG